MGTDLLWAFQKLHWKELKGGKWRVERAVPDFKVPFSEFSSKCWKLKFVFVSVFSPLPLSFILFKLHSSGEGAEKIEPDPSWRHTVEGGAAVGSSRQQLIQGKIGLGMIRHYLTMSTVKQHWLRLSRKAGKSPSWESAASKFLFPLDCTMLYFYLFFSFIV